MATGATEFIDHTTADVFLPEVWSAEAIIAREQALVFANLVDRRFEEGLKYGDLIHVPSVGNLAARTKALGSNAAITYETVTETNTDITVATWEYAAIAVEDGLQVQANRDMLKLYAGKMGYALALAIDDVLAGLPDDFSNIVGTLAIETTDDELLRAIQYLDDANAPQEGRVFVFSPAGAIGLLKLDRFVHNDYSRLHGEMTTDFDRSYVTSFLTYPIYKSTNVEGSNAVGHDNTLFQRQALALVMSMKPKTRHMYDIDYLVDKIAMEQLSGAREMRDDHGAFIRGA